MTKISTNIFEQERSLAADTQMALEKGLYYRDQVECLIGELDDVTRERDRLTADNARLSGIYV